MAEEPVAEEPEVEEPNLQEIFENVLQDVVGLTNQQVNSLTTNQFTQVLDLALVDETTLFDTFPTN